MTIDRFLAITDQNGRMHKIDCEPDGYRSFGDVSLPPYKLTLKDGTSVLISDKKVWDRLTQHKRNYLSGKMIDKSVQISLLQKLAAIEYTTDERDLLKQLLTQEGRMSILLDELSKLLG